MKVFRKALKWIGLSLLLLLCAGAVYEQIGLAIDKELAPPPSEMIRIGNRSVRMVCMGEGPRTFLLDGGLSAWSVFWWRIQPLLAEAGRACAFDRAGMGWSDASSTGYDGVAAADELAALVRAAKISTPFIYVGHSLGANYAQIYYGKRPQDVSALVLMEPGDPKDLLEDFHGTRAEAMSAQDCGATCYAAAAAGFLGVGRLVALTAPGHSFAGRTRQEYRAGLARPSYPMAVAATLSAIPKTAFENLDVTSFQDTPVLAFYSSAPREPEGKETVEDVKKWHEGYLRYLGSLVAKSSRGSGPVEVPNSTHVTMVLGEPQAAAVSQAIIAFVSEASGKQEGRSGRP